jgi:hypothetical protein
MRPCRVLYTTDRRQTADGTGDNEAALDCTAGRPSHGGGRYPQRRSRPFNAAQRACVTHLTQSTYPCLAPGL